MYKRITVAFFILVAGALWLLGRNSNVTTKELFILSWPNTFDQALIEKFEKKYHITVHISFYTSNEELITKMLLRSSNSVDLIIPSGYAIPSLIAHNLIAPLIVEKIPLFNQLYHKLLLPNTKNTTWGIPFEWHVYGFILTEKTRRKFIETPYDHDTFLHAFFNRSRGNALRICMTNDVVAAALLAGEYYKKFFPNDFMEHQLRETIIYELLKKQKPLVTLYSDYRIAWLFKNNIVDTAFTQTYEYFIALRENPTLSFLIDDHCSFITVEYGALVKGSCHEDEVYQFINFMLEEEQMEQNIRRLGAFPPFYALANKIYTDEKEQEIVQKIFDRNFHGKECAPILSDRGGIAVWSLLKSQ